jgi:hypothetical protein
MERLFHAVGEFMSQDELLDEQDRIGIKPVEPTYVFPRSNYAHYGERDLDKTQELLVQQSKMAGQSMVAIRTVASNKSWITPT